VIVDEGMAPWLVDTDYGKELLNLNNLYSHQPPLDVIPANIKDFKLS